jgi:cell wall-associated NlpC family hydrolase
MNPLELIGTPFELGGTTPAAFDCWGLVEYVRRESFGLATPIVELAEDHGTYAAVRAIDASRKHWQKLAAPGRPGDVVGMARRSSGPLHHVGVALEHGVLHAYRGETGVGGSVLFTPWARLVFTFPLVEVFRWPN